MLEVAACSLDRMPAKKWDIAYARPHGIKVLANIEAALAE